MSPEYKNDTREGELITLREILSIIKYRNEEKEKYLTSHYEELRKEIPTLTNINFEGEYIFLRLNEPPRDKRDTYAGIMLMLKNNQFIPYDDWKLTKEEINTIKKHQSIFEDINRYSKDNNYDKPLSLTTISNLYKFAISDNELFVYLSLDAIKERFYFTYDPLDTKDKRIMQTNEGPITIHSNVFGVEKLFFKPKTDIVENHYLDEKNTALRFLNHTKAYLNDLPNFILEEREKILHLTK